MKNFVKSIATAAVVGCAVLLVLLVGVFVLLIIAPKRLVKIAYVVFFGDLWHSDSLSCVGLDRRNFHYDKET